MTRYTSTADLVPFSQLRPDRFDRDDSQYVAPEAGVDRDVDHAPMRSEAGRPVYANRGYSSLKGR